MGTSFTSLRDSRLSVFFFLAFLAWTVALPLRAKPGDKKSEAATSSQSEKSPYDEIFLPDGRIRPQYAEIYAIYKGLSPEEKVRLARKTRKDFEKDNALDTLPRLITLSEYTKLKEGVEQRGRALTLFLKDYYSGNYNQYEKKGIVPPIPSEVLRKILDRNGEGGFLGYVRPDDIAFPYGPDIIRDSRGKWRVIEDNPGYIGGIGDLLKARGILGRRFSDYLDRLPVADNPYQFYGDIAARYRARARPPGSKIVIFATPPYPDREDKRMKKIFRDLGVVWVTPNSKHKSLLTKEDGVYLREDYGGQVTEKRVGFIALDTEHPTFEWKHPAIEEKALIDEAKGHLSQDNLDPDARIALMEALRPDLETGKVDLKAIRKALKKSNYFNEVAKSKDSPVPGVFQAILSGKVATNYSPGLDFIGDKEFYMYVEKLIQFYLKEKPLLRNIPTGTFLREKKGRKVLDEAIYWEVRDHQNDYVIKKVDGRGGEGIAVGPKVSAKEFRRALKQVRRDPASYQWQKYTSLSLLANRIVDLRMVSMVDPLGVYVSPTPWGRAIDADGDGKVNISGHGVESAVVVVDIERLRGCAQAAAALAL